MILGKTESEIVKLASKYQSEITDGVVQYDFKTGKLFGASFTSGEMENPANPHIEVFRLEQGEMGEIDMDCDDCPYKCDFEGFDRSIYPATKKECCIDAYVDNHFEEDFEYNFKDDLEEQIRDVLSSHLGDVISELNEVRIALSDKCNPNAYFEIRSDDWELRVLDSYVESAMEDGFTTTIAPRDYIDQDVESLALIFDDAERYSEFVNTLRDGDFYGALELLQ